MFEITLLALQPGRLRRLVRVCAAVDDLDDLVTEAAADLLPGWLAALVLDGVVQQGRDGFVFAAAILKNQSRDSKKMRDIGDRGPLTFLVSVQTQRIEEGGPETFRVYVHVQCSGRWG